MTAPAMLTDASALETVSDRNGSPPSRCPARVFTGLWRPARHVDAPPVFLQQACRPRSWHQWSDRVTVLQDSQHRAELRRGWPDISRAANVAWFRPLEYYTEQLCKA